MNNPQPLTKPQPPILIGGSGEKKTLRFVAQYADACNLFAFMGTEELAHELDVLRQHCDDYGRDYGEIEKTALSQINLGGGYETIRPNRVLSENGHKRHRNLHLQNYQRAGSVTTGENQRGGDSGGARILAPADATSFFNGRVYNMNWLHVLDFVHLIDT